MCYCFKELLQVECLGYSAWEYVCKRNKFRVWIHLKRCHFPNFNTISNPLGLLTLFASTVPFFWPLQIIGLLLCSIKGHPKST